MSEKIVGYKEQPAAVIEAVNHNKGLENSLGEWIEILRANDELAIDPKFTAIAVLHFQQGFMALTRALTKPESRLK